MLNINENNINFYKNHLVRGFEKIYQKFPGLEIIIINNSMMVSYWRSSLKRLRHFKYKLPEQVSANFNVNKKNDICGIIFKLNKGDYRLALTEIKLLYNTILGIVKPHEKIIEIHGTGFKFNVIDEYPSKNNILEVHAGFNESKKLFLPENVYIKKLDPTYLNIYSNNKDTVASFASTVKKVKPLNRYKLRGIKFNNEKFIPKVYKKSK